MMIPFYEDYAVTLWHADARDLVALLGVYQHAILDPPYDAQTHAGARSSDKGYEIKFAPIDSPDTVVQLVKPTRWAIAFSPLELLGEYRRAAGAERWARAGVWDRVSGSPQFTGDRPAQGAEGLAIWHSEHERKRWNGGGKRGIWRHNIVPPRERIMASFTGVDERVHETQKPLSLMRELVLDFTDPDDLILDCFAGSGTLGVAAKLCGRRAILVELNGLHCATAARRLAETSLDERVSRVKGVRAKQGAIDWTSTGAP
jgi:DNA methylase